MLKVGDKAPVFTAPTDSDGTIDLADFQGKRVVVYFYPKDNTSGCTKQACSFRDGMDTLTKLGVVVIGVSPDSPSSHDKFKAKHDLNFTLVSDIDKKICEMYYAIGEKSMYGKKYMGVIRSTFIISPEGIIEYANYKVKAADHANEIIDVIGKL